MDLNFLLNMECVPDGIQRSCRVTPTEWAHPCHQPNGFRRLRIFLCRSRRTASANNASPIRKIGDTFRKPFIATCRSGAPLIAYPILSVQYLTHRYAVYVYRVQSLFLTIWLCPPLLRCYVNHSANLAHSSRRLAPQYCATAPNTHHHHPMHFHPQRRSTFLPLLRPHHCLLPMLLAKMTWENLLAD